MLGMGNSGRGRSSSNSSKGSSRSSSRTSGNTSNRGFASMSDSKQRQIAAKGGKASYDNDGSSSSRSSRSTGSTSKSSRTSGSGMNSSSKGRSIMNDGQSSGRFNTQGGLLQEVRETAHRLDQLVGELTGDTSSN